MAERIAEVEVGVDGERCAGWLHLPEGAGPHPCVVMLHSTAGLRQMRCYADRGRAFAAAGIATLQFDCRGFGASGGEPRQLFDVRRQAEDLEAALAFARTREEIDPERLALWGASASCAQVLAAAAAAPDIRAVVCLTPFVPGRATQRSAGTPILRLARAAFADRLRMAIGRDPQGVAVGGEPGAPAILVGEDAAAREAAMLPPEARLDPSGNRAELPGGIVWENRVVLRPRLRTPHPLRLAPKVNAPLLVIAGEHDTLCPPGPAAELANRAPNAHFETLPHAHFDLYDGVSIPTERDFLLQVLAQSCGFSPMMKSDFFESSNFTQQ
ncbi:MAG TPA: alpha/beta hydrolase [Solirubrobacterales bacterium]|nr:alpha/beta hydrolase [Solirubrobacterales bacterium]